MLLPVRATDTVDIPVEEGSAVTGMRALLIVCQVDPDVSADVIRLYAISLTSRRGRATESRMTSAGEVR